MIHLKIRSGRILYACVLLLPAGFLYGGGKAWIFKADNLPPVVGSLQTWPRAAVALCNYKYAGYTVYYETATQENILKALLDPETRAITIFSHGSALEPGTAEIVPTAGGNITASEWKAIMRAALKKRYEEQGLSPEEVRDRVAMESENFGLESFANYSCRSSVNLDIGNLFVKPGGVYWGTTKSYSASPLGVYCGDAETALTKYIIGMQPGWGNGPPAEYGLNPSYTFVWPPYGGDVKVYQDGDKYWMFTNCWVKYLEKDGNGFIEYEPGNPPKAVLRYKHDDDIHETDITDRNGNIIRTEFMRWGTNYKMNGEELGRYYMKWNTVRIPGFGQ